MRERLIAAFVGLAIVVVALYGVPRAYVVADQALQFEQQKIERAADLLAVTLPDVAESRGITVSYLQTLLQEGDRVSYTDPTSAVLSAGPELTGHPDDIRVTRQLGNGSSVTLERTGTLVADRVAGAVMPVVLIGLALIVFSAFAGFILARLLARPFQELAVVAEQLGTGKFDLEEKQYSVPEAQEIGTALHTSSQALAELLRREREFAANASHQLRTPITALRLELEDLSYWKETPPTVAAQLNHSLGEIDRLSTAVSELLELARGHRPAGARELDLATVATEAANRWQRQTEARNRRIVSGSGAIPAVTNPGPVNQILDVLIENALNHGKGAITVQAADAGSHLSLSVSDEGPRPRSDRIFARRTASNASGSAAASGSGSGEGIGLAVASELADAIGGHLVLGPEEHTTFTLMLPKRSRP
ncbi:HAMP domain-containing protein [Arthrobacter sp. JZ12]|uniref:sensor histidine kinase n=1 Tax=Arthrobacter sp. JZ12 TaxID=2654190 RepID=UPI002B475F8E|nr:HAMP domain-containing sensor histidine kinase [Arthrobacter sp. JZ12]WRH24243.1 HAMP domain-containing protein [Arthrobacter sp. JZ12]